MFSHLDFQTPTGKQKTVSLLSYDIMSDHRDDDSVKRCKDQVVGIVRLPFTHSSRRNSESAVTGALEIMGAIPDKTDVIVCMSRTPTQEEIENIPSLDATRERLKQKLANSDGEEGLMREIQKHAKEIFYIYDYKGEHDAYIPHNSFSFPPAEEPDRQPPEFPARNVVFTGDLAKCCHDEKRVAAIETGIVHCAAIDFMSVMSFPTNMRSATYASRNLYGDKQVNDIHEVFNAFCMGYRDFPMDDALIERLRDEYERGPSKPFLDVFYQSNSLNSKASEDLRRFMDAKNFFVSAVKVWDRCLSQFGVPLTVSHWERISHEEKWDIANMHKIGQLIGVEPYLRALSMGISVRDLTLAD